MAPDGSVNGKKPTLEDVKATFKENLRKASHLTTTKGNKPWAQVDGGSLRKVEGGHENDNEIGAFVEYYDGDELVHRSVHVHLKRPFVESVGEIQNFKE